MRKSPSPTTPSNVSNKPAAKRLALSRETLRTVRGGDGLSLYVATKSTPTLITSYV